MKLLSLMITLVVGARPPSTRESHDSETKEPIYWPRLVGIVTSSAFAQSEPTLQAQADVCEGRGTVGGDQVKRTSKQDLF